MIFAGTSGYSFKEWVGTFYPEKTPAKAFLSHYAKELASVEINHTFRRFPREELVRAWAEQTPESFKFSFKMHQSVTHRARLRNVRRSLEDFMNALVPLGPRLGAVLFQLPPFFKRDLERLDAFLDDLPPGPRYAMEFRHDSWREPVVLERLRCARVALAAADLEIDITAEVPVTAPFAYVRFRKEPPYPDEDVVKAREIVARLSQQVEDIYLYVKHDDNGRAPLDVKAIGAPPG